MLPEALAPLRWDSFQRMFDASGCADIPWVVLPGNHDGRQASMARDVLVISSGVSSNLRLTEFLSSV